METKHGWDDIIVQRWQLQHIETFLLEIENTLDATSGNDSPYKISGVLGGTSGLARSLRGLVREMQGKERDDEAMKALRILREESKTLRAGERVTDAEALADKVLHGESNE